VKNAFEAVRGRDIIKDKIVAGSRLARFNVTAEALADTETRKVKATSGLAPCDSQGRPYTRSRSCTR
jgi:hypothetical protein